MHQGQRQTDPGPAALEEPAGDKACEKDGDERRKVDEAHAGNLVARFAPL